MGREPGPGPDGPPVTVDDKPLADTVEEGRRITSLAAARGIEVKLFGGVAVAITCKTASHPALRRTYKDVDLATAREHKRTLEKFLAAIGYLPAQEFNALHGRTRLLFTDPVNGRPLDVIVDHFAMCHSLDLRPRLRLQGSTLPTADLLLMKLQVIETNERDLQDAVALLLDGDVDAGRVAAVLAADWGWWRTATEALGKVESYAASIADPDLAAGAAKEIERLRDQVEQAPKGLRWRTRAKIGDRARWYELPEEAHG
jgi:hypothetical protein